MTATTLNLIEQSAVSLLTTEMNTLGTNAMSSAGGAINNVFATSGWLGYVMGKLALNLAAYSGTPNAGSTINGWFLLSPDGGTTYEDGSSSIQPARAPDFIIPVRAVASGPQLIIIDRVRFPVGNFKPIVLNNNLGLSLASTGNTLKALPSSFQGQ